MFGKKKIGGRTRFPQMHVKINIKPDQDVADIAKALINEMYDYTVRGKDLLNNPRLLIITSGKFWHDQRIWKELDPINHLDTVLKSPAYELANMKQPYYYIIDEETLMELANQFPNNPLWRRWLSNIQRWCLLHDHHGHRLELDWISLRSVLCPGVKIQIIELVPPGSLEIFFVLFYVYHIIYKLNQICKHMVECVIT